MHTYIERKNNHAKAIKICIELNERMLGAAVVAKVVCEFNK